MPSPRRTRSGKLRRTSPSPVKQEVLSTPVEAAADRRLEEQRLEEQRLGSRVLERLRAPETPAAVARRVEEQGLEVLRGSTPQLPAAGGGGLVEERGSRQEVVDISDTEDVDEQVEASGGGNETANDVVILDVTENSGVANDDSVIDLTEEVVGARREGLGASPRRELLGARPRAYVPGARARREALARANEVVGAVREEVVAGAVREEVVAGALSPLRLGARLGTCLSSGVSTPSGCSAEVVDLTDSPAPQDSQQAGLLQCPVCMDSLQELSEGRHSLTTRCGHLFCSTCLPAAIRANGRCPTCRKKIRAKDSVKIFL